MLTGAYGLGAVALGVSPSRELDGGFPAHPARVALSCPPSTRRAAVLASRRPTRRRWGVRPTLLGALLMGARSPGAAVAPSLLSSACLALAGSGGGSNPRSASRSWTFFRARARHRDGHAMMGPLGRHARALACRIGRFVRMARAVVACAGRRHLRRSACGAGAAGPPHVAAREPSGMSCGGRRARAPRALAPYRARHGRGLLATWPVSPCRRSYSPSARRASSPPSRGARWRDWAGAASDAGGGRARRGGLHLRVAAPLVSRLRSRPTSAPVWAGTLAFVPAGRYWLVGITSSSRRRAAAASGAADRRSSRHRHRAPRGAPVFGLCSTRLIRTRRLGVFAAARARCRQLPSSARDRRDAAVGVAQYCHS